MIINITENNGLKLLGVIDNYSSLIWTESFKSTGDFSLEVPLLKTTFEILKVGKQIYLDKELSHRMIIEKVQTKVSLDKGLILISSGRCAKSLLSRRIIWEEIRKENLNLLQAIDLVISQNMRGLPIKFDKSKHAFLEKYKIDGIHLSYNIFKSLNQNIKAELIKKYKRIGVSIHSLEEAKDVESLGASYVIAGHIFETDCKKGLEPRGLKFIEDLSSALSIPIFAIGGIDEKNSQSVINSGAFSVCMMSNLMKY